MDNKKKAHNYCVRKYNKSGIVNREQIEDAMVYMAKCKDREPIADTGGWETDKPKKDCFVLLMTQEFPKNCFYIVAEWDNDAQCFYSEASDRPVENWDCWKLIEMNDSIKQYSYGNKR